MLSFMRKSLLLLLSIPHVVYTELWLQKFHNIEEKSLIIFQIMKNDYAKQTTYIYQRNALMPSV